MRTTRLIPAILLLIICRLGFGQGRQAFSVLQPSKITRYSIEEGLPDRCVRDAFLDQQGRLWLKGCRTLELDQTLSLYQVDGYETYPATQDHQETNIESGLHLSGLTQKGELLGFFSETNSLFFFDPQSNQKRMLTLQDSLEGKIVNVFAESDQVLLYAFTPYEYLIYELDQDSTRLLVKADRDRSIVLWGLKPFPILQSGDDIWFMDEGLPLLRFNKTTNSLRTYTEADMATSFPLQNKGSQIVPEIVEDAQGNILLFLPFAQEKVLKLDTLQDRFVPLDIFPSGWRPVEAENYILPVINQDLSGNLLFIYKDWSGTTRGILQTTHQEVYDYSSVLKAGQGVLQSVRSRNFERSAYISRMNGFYAVGVKWPGAVNNYSTSGAGALVQLSNYEFLVLSQSYGQQIINTISGTIRSFRPRGCRFNPHSLAQYVRDNAGYVWLPFGRNLIQYHHQRNECRRYPVGIDFHKFAFVNARRLVFVDLEQEELLFYNLQTQEIDPFLIDGQPLKVEGTVNQILVGRNGKIWIAGNQGLWSVNPADTTAQLFGMEAGFEDVRIMCLEEAEDGKIWAGTFFAGLHIFDPQTGEVEIIDKKKGLSNNTVVSILTDQKGVRWVGTYNGITLLSPNGEVLTKVFREDGLSDDECNRFSYCKATDGRLLVGSVQGVNIIHPDTMKNHLFGQKDLKLYLTGISYFGSSQKEGEYTRKGVSVDKPIRLPADKRYIRLKFALSSYIQADKNQYAYKLEGKSKDWTFIGSVNELNLNDLPPGKYNILIKGSDYRGNWAPEPIVIRVHARDFFYRQFWFYVLCSIPLLVFGYSWVRGKALETQRLEREVAIRTQEIEQDKALIEQQAEELKRLDQVKSNFFANISHELRTPLTLILGPLDAALKEKYGTVNQRLHAAHQNMYRNGKKLLRLIEEILDLSKLESGKLQVKEQATVFPTFVRRIFASFESAARAKSIRYLMDMDIDEELTLLLDRDKVERILNNLLSNALKFTAPEGYIHLMVTQLPDAPKIRIRVRDSGKGIPEEDLPHVFDRFFQSKNPNDSNKGGTGIGLALAKEFAQLMNGRLEVESKYGEGSTFILEMPVKEVPKTVVDGSTVSDEEYDLLLPLPAIESTGRQDECLLLVEDTPDMQEFIQSVLSPYYQLLLASNGKEALDVLSQNAVDLIISDVMMPEMDGFALLNYLKNADQYSHLPVIMLTARAQETDKLHALRIGVDDYLTKPFSTDELLVRIQNLLQNTRQRTNGNPRASNTDRQPPESPTFSVADREWLEVTEAIIVRELKNSRYGLADLAHELALSERQLHRNIKRMTGLTPNKYIREIKLHKARELLEAYTYNTIAEVSYAVGFEDPHYFSKLYTAHFGKKPSEYLQQGS